MANIPCGPGFPTHDVLAACLRGDARARVELVERARWLLPVMRRGLGMPASLARDVLRSASDPATLKALPHDGSLWRADEVLVASIVREIQRRHADKPWPMDPKLAVDLAPVAQTPLSARLTFLLYYWSEMAISRIAAVMGSTPTDVSADCDRLFEALDYYEELVPRAPTLTVDDRIHLHGLARTPSTAFHGRGLELQVLHDAWTQTHLNRGPGVLEVIAEPGMGKSALLLHWIAHLSHRTGADQPQLIFGWRFGTEESQRWAAFVAALHAALPGQFTIPSASALARGLGTARTLLVLEGCDDPAAPPELSELLAAMCLPSGPGQSLCITLSERPLQRSPPAALHLGPLSAGASARLLRERFALVDSDEALREVGVALGGNPANLCALGEHAAPHWSSLAAGSDKVTALIDRIRELVTRKRLAESILEDGNIAALREAAAREARHAASAAALPSPPASAASLCIITCIPDPTIRAMHPRILRQLRQHLTGNDWHVIEDRSGTTIASAATARAIVVLYCLDIASATARLGAVKALIPDHGRRMFVLTVDPMLHKTPDTRLTPLNPRPLGALRGHQRDQAFMALCAQLEPLMA